MHEPENTLMCEQSFQGNGYYPTIIPKEGLHPAGAGSDGGEGPTSRTGLRRPPAAAQVSVLNTEPATPTKCNQPWAGGKEKKK